MYTFPSLSTATPCDVPALAKVETVCPNIALEEKIQRKIKLLILSVFMFC